MTQRSVLIIEDDPAVARATQKMLHRSGFDVFLANSGEAGEQELRANPGCVDTVLLDYTLPGANGFEVFDRLKGLFPELRIIMMSGYDPDSFPQDLSGYDFAGFLQKPFMMRQLVSMLDSTAVGSLSRNG